MGARAEMTPTPPTAAPDASRIRRFRRHFARLWLGQVATALGDRLHEVALVWIAVESVGEQAGFVMAAGALSRLAFGFPGGALADRWDRQWTLIGCDLVSAAAVATLLLATPGSDWILLQLAAVAAVLGMLDSLFQPALQASLPAIAPDLGRLQVANAWLDITRRLALALGPSATGLLLAWIPLQSFFGLDALTFVLSAILIGSLGRRYAWRAPARDRARRASLGSEIVGAARLVARERRLVWALGQHVVWNFSLSSAMTLGLAMIVDGELDGGPALLGYATGAYGAGNVLSNLVLARSEVRHTTRMVHLGALVAAVGWAGVAIVTNVPLWLVVIAATAIGGPMTDLMLLRLIQTRFPPDQIGKVYSFRFTLSRAAAGLGLMVAPAVYGAIGPRGGIALGSAVLGSVALWGLAGAERREREALAR
jgi:MFS family permease